ncbi:MAG: hypothetical protein Q8Q30_03295 [Candidatus Woesebacteria bacterium]|nr:hypothetical protein [Candidatus Woesebacteria bacterium]
MENSFASLISSANEILVLLPNKPYLDQVAGGLSLYLSLLGLGKKVSIFCPVSMTAEYSRLIGVDKVTTDLENHNLTIKFVNYEATDVDKVSYDILDGQFKLTITPKLGFKSPTKDQVDVSYSGISCDLVILIGGANDSHFPILNKEEFKNTKLVHIGTRLLEVINNDLQVLSFARPASSTSELITLLLKESGYSIDSDIATNLVTGIEEQSKNFQGESVTADTFTIFAELLKLGGKRMQKVVQAKNYPQGSIPTKPFTQTINRQMTPEEAEEELNQEIPASWSEPKIFTGTTVS